MQCPEHLVQHLQQRLDADGRAALAALATAAGRHHSTLYLVGGSVRDLLLGHDHLDLDFVVEAAAPAVARDYARASGARVVVHDRFLTATVIGPALTFDLVTARRETYPEPGALPVVTPAALADDLARRDFTLNALALALSGPQAGSLIDPYSGLADLRARRLRVLHPDSFVDDPTRLWRAARYASRFALRLDPSTAAAVTPGLPALKLISPARIGHELERTLTEARPERALHRLDRWGVLPATLPGLRCTAAVRTAAARARALAPADAAAACLATLFVPWPAARIDQPAERFALSRHQGQVLRALPGLRQTLHLLVARQASAGTAALELERFPEAALAAYAARNSRTPAGRLALHRLLDWARIQPALTARDLIAAGVRPGPLLGELLRALRAARIDGEVTTLDGEHRLVNTVLEERRRAELAGASQPVHEESL